MIRAAILVGVVIAGYKITKKKKKKLPKKGIQKALPPAQPMITLEDLNE